GLVFRSPKGHGLRLRQARGGRASGRAARAPGAVRPRPPRLRRGKLRQNGHHRRVTTPTRLAAAGMSFLFVASILGFFMQPGSKAKHPKAAPPAQVTTTVAKPTP